METLYLYDDNIGCVQYIQHMGTDKTIVNSARVSFGQDNDKPIDDRDKKLIRYLLNHKHTSTLEHCSITFKFVVPLFIRSQHHRHRTWSYNEISRRYTDEDIKFFEPQAFRTQHTSNRQASNKEVLVDPTVFYHEYEQFSAHFMNASRAIKLHNKLSLDFYNTLIKEGVCREQARGVLPQNMYTEYYGTVNLNNLFKFVDLRTHDGAQLEIQKVALACLEIAEKIFPEAVAAYKESKIKPSMPEDEKDLLNAVFSCYINDGIHVSEEESKKAEILLDKLLERQK